jgi:glucose-6-phosphate isomerase
MPFQQDLSKAFVAGLTEASHREALKAAGDAVKRLKREARDGTVPLLGLPKTTADLSPVKAMARALRKGARDVVFMGTGGSALGGQTLAQLGGYNIPGVTALLKGPRVHFMDNLDGQTFSTMLEKLDLHRTKFVAISKSGGTGETLMQTIAVIEALTAAGCGDHIANHVYGLSEPEKPGHNNALRDLLAPYGVTFLDHHTGVGGRYSCLTNVGLLPAAVMGLDIRAIRKGAGLALEQLMKAKQPEDCPAACGAALQIAAQRSGRNITVVMPYADRLERFTKWFVQLWAESNGKDGKGTQPVATLGPVDQHSSQQLFLAGPKDKLFTVITVASKGLGPRIGKELAAHAHEPGFAGKTFGDMVSAQGEAMVDTFAKNGCAVRRIRLDVLNETTLGALLMHFMIETILSGYLMGVNPFDQPAVEEAKVLAKRYLAEGR